MDNQIPVANENAQQDVQAQEEFDVEKAVDAFDVTRKARTEALEQIDKALNRVSSGWNMDKKEQAKCLRQFYYVCLMQEMLLRGLMADLVIGIRSMAQNEVEVVNLKAKLFTITQALYSKNLMTQDDLEKIHQEVTVPQLLAKFQRNEEKQEE